MDAFGGADLHSHSTFSDGVESPAGLVARALSARLSVLALTDHDALMGLGAFEEASRGTGLVAAGGTELSIHLEGEDVHVVGLFVDPSEPGLGSKLAEMREARARRGEQMVDRLAELGVALDREAIRAVVGEGSYGRPHVARALVDGGHARNVQDAFDRYLARGRPAYVRKRKWGLDEAISSIRGAGGLSILAHPVWYKEPARVLAQAVEAGLDAIEVWHTDQVGREEEYLEMARQHRLLVSAGSDFHGSGEGGREVGLCRLGEQDWTRLAEAGAARRLAAGRPALDLAPR